MASTSQEQEEPQLLSLPKEMVLNCLARVSRWDRPNLSLVSKSFRSLVASPELQAMRSHLGCTEQCLYVSLGMPGSPTHWWSALRPGHPHGRFVPVPCNFELPGCSSVVAAGSNMYVIGGAFRSCPTPRVFLLDCLSNTWRYLPDMRLPRISPAVGVIDGKIYVLGGCESHSFTEFGEVFDPETQTWEPLTYPDFLSESGPVHVWSSLTFVYPLHGMVMDNKVCGIFHKVRFSYEPKEGRWETTLDGALNGLIKCCCVVDNVLYSLVKCNQRPRENVLFWYDSEELMWRKLTVVMMKPLPKIGLFGMENHGGKLVIMCASDKEGGIRYWQIALERRHPRDIWGKVECSEILPAKLSSVVAAPPHVICCVSVAV